MEPNHSGKTASSCFPAGAVILAGVLWGCISIFIKHLNAGGLDSFQIAWVRMVMATLMFGAFTLITDPGKLRIRLRDVWMFIGTGIVSVVLFNISYFYTMTHTDASVAVVLLYTSPVFIMLMSAVLFKEKITPVKLVALVLTVGGCVLVAGLLGGGYTIPPFCILTGLGAGLFYALYTIFGRYALARYDTVTVTFYTFFFGLIGSTPLGKIGATVSTFRADPMLLLWGAGIGLVSTVLPYFFYTWGLRRMDSGKAAILVAVEPLVGALIGMTVYHESHDALKLLGMGCIFAAIILLNLPDGRKKV